MVSPLPRLVLILLLLGMGPALTQPVPQAKPAIPPPAHAKPAQTAKPPTPAKPAKPAKPPQAPETARPPAHPAPVVRPRPGPQARQPAAPAHRPPAVVPVPAAPPTAAPEPEKPTEPGKGSNTGNPLPRFATLRTDEVNMRTGPGTRYPIDWVYKRRDLPVLIEREFEIWRLVRDPEGVKGWVHQATLAPRRTGVVVAASADPTLRADPKDTATAVARLKPGVIVRLRSCEATSDWCQAQVQDYRGWIKRSDVWGVFPGEVIQ